jgi:hypothetical protein
MTKEERAPKIDAIIRALESGNKIEHILKELTHATQDDLSFVTGQDYVSVVRTGLASSTITYSLKPKGREIFDAGGLLSYLELARMKEEKSLNNSEIEKQVNLLQKEKLEYEQNLRNKDSEIKRLQMENLKLSNEHLENQNDIAPIDKMLKYIELFKVFMWIAGGIIAGTIIEYSLGIMNRLIEVGV